MDTKKNKFFSFRDRYMDMIMLGTVASYILLIVGLAVGIYEVMTLALALMIISFAFNSLAFFKEKEVIDKCSKVLLKDGYVDKDEFVSVSKVMNAYRYIYYADIINCTSRIVDLIIPEN
jgi:Zn-dependent membrane protease YugP